MMYINKLWTIVFLGMMLMATAPHAAEDKPPIRFGSVAMDIPATLPLESYTRT